MTPETHAKQYQVKAWADGLGWVRVRTDQVGGSDDGRYADFSGARAAALRLQARTESWMSATPPDDRRVSVWNDDIIAWRSPA